MTAYYETSCDGAIAMCFIYNNLFQVIEMEKTVPQKKVALEGKVVRLLKGGILRLLGTSQSLEEPPSYQEITDIPINYQEIKTALLETEQRKAKALMDWQKRRLIC